MGYVSIISQAQQGVCPKCGYSTHPMTVLSGDAVLMRCANTLCQRTELERRQPLRGAVNGNECLTAFGTIVPEDENMKSQSYTQCRLERPQDDDTTRWDEVWIPTEFAVVGKRLSLKKGEGWEDGWYVKIRGVTRTEEWLKEHERDWLRQRRASDMYRKDGHWETVP